MKLRMMWTTIVAITALPFANSATAVDKQMPPALKRKCKRYAAHKVAFQEGGK